MLCLRPTAPRARQRADRRGTRRRLSRLDGQPGRRRDPGPAHRLAARAARPDRRQSSSSTSTRITWRGWASLGAFARAGPIAAASPRCHAMRKPGGGGHSVEQVHCRPVWPEASSRPFHRAVRAVSPRSPSVRAGDSDNARGARGAFGRLQDRTQPGGGRALRPEVVGQIGADGVLAYIAIISTQLSSTATPDRSGKANCPNRSAN